MKSKTFEQSPRTGSGMDVEIGFPECVHIELVQANDLRNYEIFLWLDSIFFSATAGFWVAFATLPFNKTLFGVSMVFTGFSIGFFVLAWHFRTKLNGRKIKKIIKVREIS